MRLLAVLCFALIFLSGCSKDVKITETTGEKNSLAGYYVAVKEEHADGSYTPEALYNLQNNGVLIVQNYYERGTASAEKDIYSGTYKIVGSKIIVSNYRQVIGCQNDYPSESFEFNFKKNGSEIIVYDSEGILLRLKKADSNVIDKFKNTNACFLQKKSSQPVTLAPSSPTEPPKAGSTTKNALNKPSVETLPPQSDYSANKNWGAKTDVSGSVQILPREIKPVIIDSHPNPKYPHIEPYIEFENNDWVEAVVKAAKITCRNKNDCPSFVGLLIAKSNIAGTNRMFQCSATYLGNGYFSSNSHCYPDEISWGEYNKKCANKIWVKMPAAEGYAEELFNCDEVIYLTKLNSNQESAGREQNDVMIFKVKEKVNRKSASIDLHSIVNQGEILKTWTVNPVTTLAGLNGEVVSKSCVTYDPRNVLQWFKSNVQLKDMIYQNISFENCSDSIVKGNSGSTLFNSQGKGVAILSHGYVKPEISLSNSGYGTKYGCVGSDAYASDLGKAFNGDKSEQKCVAFSNADIDTLINNIGVKLHNNVIDNFNRIQQKLTRIINSGFNPIDYYENSRSIRSGNFELKEWEWSSAIVNVGSQTVIRYKPTEPYTAEKISWPKDANGYFLFNEPVPFLQDQTQNINNPFENYYEGSYAIKDVGVYQFELPRCLSFDSENLSRKRTDSWSPFDEVTYEYDPVTIQIPLNFVYKKDYSLSPEVVRNTDDIEQIRYQALSSPTSLNFSVSVTLKPGKYGLNVQEVIFNPRQVLASNPLASKIDNRLRLLSRCR